MTPMAAFNPPFRLYRRQEIILPGGKYEIDVHFRRESDNLSRGGAEREHNLFSPGSRRSGRGSRGAVLHDRQWADRRSGGYSDQPIPRGGVVYGIPVGSV